MLELAGLVTLIVNGLLVVTLRWTPRVTGDGRISARWIVVLALLVLALVVEACGIVELALFATSMGSAFSGRSMHP